MAAARSKVEEEEETSITVLNKFRVARFNTVKDYLQRVKPNTWMTLDEIDRRLPDHRYPLSQFPARWLALLKKECRDETSLWSVRDDREGGEMGEEATNSHSDSAAVVTTKRAKRGREQQREEGGEEEAEEKLGVLDDRDLFDKRRRGDDDRSGGEAQASGGQRQKQRAASGEVKEGGGEGGDSFQISEPHKVSLRYLQVIVGPYTGKEQALLERLTYCANIATNDGTLGLDGRTVRFDVLDPARKDFKEDDETGAQLTERLAFEKKIIVLEQNPSAAAQRRAFAGLFDSTPKTEGDNETAGGGQVLSAKSWFENSCVELFAEVRDKQRCSTVFRTSGLPSELEVGREYVIRIRRKKLQQQNKQQAAKPSSSAASSAPLPSLSNNFGGGPPVNKAPVVRKSPLELLLEEIDSHIVRVTIQSNTSIRGSLTKASQTKEVLGHGAPSVKIDLPKPGKEETTKYTPMLPLKGSLRLNIVIFKKEEEKVPLTESQGADEGQGGGKSGGNAGGTTTRLVEVTNSILAPSERQIDLVFTAKEYKPFNPEHPERYVLYPQMTVDLKNVVLPQLNQLMMVEKKAVREEAIKLAKANYESEVRKYKLKQQQQQGKIQMEVGDNDEDAALPPVPPTFDDSFVAEEEQHYDIVHHERLFERYQSLLYCSPYLAAEARETDLPKVEREGKVESEVQAATSHEWVSLREVAEKAAKSSQVRNKSNDKPTGIIGFGGDPTFASFGYASQGVALDVDAIDAQRRAAALERERKEKEKKRQRFTGKKNRNRHMKNIHCLDFTKPFEEVLPPGTTVLTERSSRRK